jgi:glycosyltransferase involved in cell wall biosynthesis
LPVSRRCLLVLGMHRSGTSALTGVLGLLGATLPREPMPAAADNPLGYWESPRITRFNNRLLASAGTGWNDDASVSAAWFADPARAADRDEALQLLAEEFAGTATFVCKDPRICRLLPFWRTVFEAAAVEPHAVVVFRDPLEVARSLAARAATPEFRPAAIASRDRALLLWLRYTIDAERFSRGLPRQAVDYAELLADWRAALAALIETGLVNQPTEASGAAVDAFLDPSLRRQRPADAEDGPGDDPCERDASPAVTAWLLAALRADRSLPVSGPAAAACDAVAPRLDRLLPAYAAVREPLEPATAADPWATVVLQALDRLPRRAGSGRSGTAVFLSGVPASVGHIYRVEHAVLALREAGWRASWLPANDPQLAGPAAEADLVVAFRAPWSGPLAEVAAICRQRGVPLVYDVDDLIFEPALMADGSVAVLAAMLEEDRLRFAATAADQRTTLERADAALLSTRPLAAAAAAHCRHTFLLPNALGPKMEAAAAEARATVAKASAVDGRPRLVFASGTPSHARDFQVAAEGIAALFARRPEPRLVLVGHINPSDYPCLAAFAERIEIRPVVPLPQVFAEVARCDVNLAPLELGNRFCEGKSAVRCLFAAAVGVPTVASPTQPLREAIIPEHTGLLATTAGDWARQLERLVDDAELRDRLGAAARVHALAESGWTSYRERAEAVFRELVELGRRSAGTPSPPGTMSA